MLEALFIIFVVSFILSCIIAFVLRGNQNTSRGLGTVEESLSRTRAIQSSEAERIITSEESVDRIEELELDDARRIERFKEIIERTEKRNNRN